MGTVQRSQVARNMFAVEALAETVADSQRLVEALARRHWVATRCFEPAVDPQRLRFRIGVGHRAGALERLVERCGGGAPVFPHGAEEPLGTQRVYLIERFGGGENGRQSLPAFIYLAQRGLSPGEEDRSSP